LRSFGDYLRRGTCIFAVIIFGGQSRPPSNCYPFYCNIMHKNAAAASGHCHCPSQRGRRLSPASLQGGGADKEGSAKTTLSGGWRGIGCKNRTATKSTTDMMLATWHWWHKQSINQLDNNTGCEIGQGSSQ
jgi:hypothetical protein